MTAVHQSNVARPTPEFSGVEFAADADGLSADKPSSSKGWRSPGGRAMIDAHASKTLAQATDAGRQTQRYLECVTRQIMARAGRQAMTVKARSRPRRRSGPRIYHHEFVGRFAFERWVELDVIARSLAMQEQVIGKLQPRDKPPVHHPSA